MLIFFQCFHSIFSFQKGLNIFIFLIWKISGPSGFCYYKNAAKSIPMVKSIKQILRFNTHAHTQDTHTYVYVYFILRVSQVVLVVKNLLANAEDISDTVPFLCWEDLLEVGMATHSNILTWRIPWTEELGGLQSVGSQRIGHD